MTDAAVEEHRQYQRGQGHVIVDDAPWDMTEIALAADTRVSLLSRLLR